MAKSRSITKWYKNIILGLIAPDSFRDILILLLFSMEGLGTLWDSLCTPRKSEDLPIQSSVLL